MDGEVEWLVDELTWCEDCSGDAFVFVVEWVELVVVVLTNAKIAVVDNINIVSSRRSSPMFGVQ